MSKLTLLNHGPYSIYYSGQTVAPSLLIERLRDARTIEEKGRGGIGLLRVDDMTLACRKYVHGGLLRAVTGGCFLSSKRARSEIDITRYLFEAGFPVVEPFCVIVERRLFAKRLYFLSLFEEGAQDLLDYLAKAGQMARFRAIRRLGQLFFRLECLGVYHPDLHLNNVLITRDGKMIFLDFDKSRSGGVSKAEVERMAWRLMRFAEKMERQGVITFSLKEKILFLRTYQRLSGYDILSSMEARAKTKRFTSRVGWYIEKLLYGK